MPAPPAFSRIVDGNLVSVQLSLDPFDPKDNQRNHILRATLSLDSVPDARFSGLIFNVKLADGVILAISPGNVVGPKTKVDTSLQGGSALGPSSLTIPLPGAISRAGHITFIHRTRGTVQGNRVGSSRAYWIIKEDNKPTAEKGLDPVFEVKIKLNVRPAIISFEVVAYILCKSGMKTIRSGILEGDLGTSV